MKPVTEAFIHKHLKSAAGTLTPAGAGELWETPVEKASGGEWYLDGVRPKKRRAGRTAAVLSSLAACLAVCFLSLYMVNFRVDATVYLDVNPSVTLAVNCGEKVIRAEANNRDGEIVLEDMDLKRADLNVAVNAIIGSMVKHGYLTEARDVALLSVSGGSAEKTAALRARLSGEINDCLTALIGAGAVLDQDVEPDGELEALSERYGITPGKAALISRVVEANPTLDYAALAGLSMNELADCLSRSGVDLRDYANYTGAPLETPTPSPVPTSVPTSVPSPTPAVGPEEPDDDGEEPDGDDDDDVDDEPEARPAAVNGGTGTAPAETAGTAGTAPAPAPESAPAVEPDDGDDDDDYDEDEEEDDDD